MHKRQPLYWLLAITLVTLLCNLNSWGVLEASEARYAEISREMFRSGDWLHPTLLNINHYHKPPVTFWLTSLGFRLFGVNAFGARFFLQVSLVIQASLVYFIAQQQFQPQSKSSIESPLESQVESQRKSLLAAIIYLSFPLSIIGTRNLTTDSFLTTFVLALIYCISSYYRQRRVWGIYGSALFIAVGFLTKGPAIFVVPFFFWCYLMLDQRINRRVPVGHFLIAFALCISLSLSWYVYVAQQVPGLADYFIGRQVIARVADDQAFNRAKPSWYYPLILVTTTLPWTVLYLISLFSREYKTFKAIDVRQILIYWIGLPFIIFALSSSKLMMYLLPIYPGIAIMSACLLASLIRLDLIRLTLTFLFYFMVLAVLIPFVPLLSTQLSGTEIATTWLMNLTGLGVIIAPVLVYRVFQNTPFRVGVIALSGALALTIYGGYLLGENELMMGGTRPLAQFIQAQGLQNQPVIVYGELLPSLAFNLDRDIITVSDDSEGNSIERETEFQTTDNWKKFWIYPDQLESKAYLARLARQSSTLVVRGDANSLPESRRWLLAGYSQTKTLGRWTLFY